MTDAVVHFPTSGKGNILFLNEIRDNKTITQETHSYFMPVAHLKPLDNIGKTEKQQCSQIYT